jgi:hypothetical protein
VQNVLPLRRKRFEESIEPVDSLPQAEAARAAEPAAEPEPSSVTSTKALVNVEHVDLGPLAWLAVRCALIVTAVGALGVFLVWTLLGASGQVGRFESFMRSIGFRHFHIAPDAVMLGLMMIVAGVTLTIAAFVVLAGAAYNLLAGSGSGIRLRVAPAPVAAAARHEVVAESEHTVEPIAEPVLERELPRSAIGSCSGPIPEPA